MPYDRLRRFNKKVTNPIMRRLAVTPRSNFAILRHIGRKSSKIYETVVLAFPFENGFLFALTYGTEVDWYRNIQAAGKCTLFWQAKEYALEKPVVVDREKALLAYPRWLRGILRKRDIQNFVKCSIVI